MIIYFGNVLIEHNRTISFNKLLYDKLKSRYDILLCSKKRNPMIRLLDMIFTYIVNIREVKFVIIDVFSTKAFYFSFVIAIISKIFKIKYITILHGGDLPNRVKKSPLMSNIVFSNSYINISPSKYLYKYFSQNNYSCKYIPNFIKIEEYPFLKRSICKPKILWVRSLHKIYNPEMAIRVLSIVSEKYPDAELCMVGPEKDESLKECLKIAKKLTIDKKLKFTGLLSQKQWIALSKDYDIFINTTNKDNMPVSVIEALALGFPIVSTNVGGLSFLLNDKNDALLVNKNDFQAMAKNIIKIINDSYLSEILSINARKKAEEFGWENISNKWIKLFDNV